MKREEITAGKIYSDGAKSLREIISIEPDGHGNMCVVYALLSGKPNGKPLDHDQECNPIFGCYLHSFQRWAKGILAPKAGATE